ncbi:MAG: anti-sigma factor [Caulobacteraceae bacterium]|nr:anti-sigma factor [Caulobacteraceae bacterium]
MSACADKALLLHALADGELDAGHALALEGHVEGCAGCAAELAGIRQVKEALLGAHPRFAAPAGLVERIEAALAAEAAPPPARRRSAAEAWVLPGTIAALAASLAVVVALPRGPSLEGQLVEAQVRSLQAQHLTDVATSDRHTVKPWFSGKIDFAPPVVDLAAQGYPLVGGRLDHLDGRPAAALVFRRGGHVINLFIWPGAASAAPTLEKRQGYSLVCWGAGGLVFWAVSDADPAALQGFQRAFAMQTSG